MKKRAPTRQDIVLSLANGTIGEIYPAIRQISFRYNKEKKALYLLVYLDREPREDDYETARYISGNVFGDYWGFFESIQEECIYSTAPQNKLDPLDGILYARREYDLEDVS